MARLPLSQCCSCKAVPHLQTIVIPAIMQSPQKEANGASEGAPDGYLSQPLLYSFDTGGCWNAPLPLGGTLLAAAFRALSAPLGCSGACWLPSWGCLMKAVTMWRRWILPVAVLGSLSVMKTLWGTYEQH